MTITIDKPPRLVVDLKLDNAPHPEQHWEGRLDLEGDSSDALTLLLVAQPRLVSGLIEGEGLLNPEGHEKTFPVLLSGEISLAGVSFAFWVHDQAFARFQVICTGELSSDERRKDGQLFSPCSDPETCNCNGATGAFSLWRVGEGGGDAAG